MMGPSLFEGNANKQTSAGSAFLLPSPPPIGGKLSWERRRRRQKEESLLSNLDERERGVGDG